MELLQKLEKKIEKDNIIFIKFILQNPKFK